MSDESKPNSVVTVSAMPLKGKVEMASSKYGDLYPVRAILQAIPYVGGSIDTMLAGPGAGWKVKRLEEFAQRLADQLEQLKLSKDLSFNSSEEMYDFIVNVMEGVSKTRFTEKLEYFARVTAKQITSPRSWDDADNAQRLLSRLSPTDIHLLIEMSQVPKCFAPFDGLRVARLSVPDVDEGPLGQGVVLQTLLPDIPATGVRTSCAELFSLGLIQDEGSARYGSPSFEFFVVSESGTWLLDWLQNPVDPT